MTKASLEWGRCKETADINRTDKWVDFREKLILFFSGKSPREVARP